MISYALTPLQARCPVCHAGEGRLLYAVDSVQAARHYVLREVDAPRFRALQAHIEDLWRGPTCRVVQCEHCGFCFADPYVAGDARFYDLAYERTGYPAWKWEFQMTLDALAARVRTGAPIGRLLEVGAGDGAFVKRVAPALLPKAQVLGTEYSAYGRRVLQDYGITCLAEDVRALNAATYGGAFDVACLFQVLEHLDGLEALFDQLGRLTAEGASLFIAVPNGQRIAFNEQHGALLDMPPNHVGRWNRQSFEVMARRFGWTVVRHAIEPEALASKARQLAVYRYLRARQERTSLANRIERVAARPLRRVLQAAAVGVYALGGLPVLPRMAREDLGETQWVHLQKGTS